MSKKEERSDYLFLLSLAAILCGIACLIGAFIR